jgi:single-strand DNA-binding protein
MPKNANTITMHGHLTRDPELKYTTTQVPVVEFGLASNGWKEGDVCFIDVKAFGKQAEPINKFLSKGREVIVTGRLEYRQWEKDGKKHSKHSIVANDVTFCGGATKDTDSQTRYEPADTEDIPF